MLRPVGKHHVAAGTDVPTPVACAEAQFGSPTCSSWWLPVVSILEPWLKVSVALLMHFKVHTIHDRLLGSK